MHCDNRAKTKFENMRTEEQKRIVDDHINHPAAITLIQGKAGEIVSEQFFIYLPLFTTGQ